MTKKVENLGTVYFHKPGEWVPVGLVEFLAFSLKFVVNVIFGFPMGSTRDLDLP